MLCSSIAMQQSFPEAFYPNIIWEAAEALEEFTRKTQKKSAQLKRCCRPTQRRLFDGKRFCHPTKHRFLESFHRDFSMAIEKCCWYAPFSDRLRSFAWFMLIQDYTVEQTYILVGGLEHVLFSPIWGRIIPID